MSDSLINRAACKKFTLQWAKDHRQGWDVTCVSKQFIDDLNTKVRLMIQGAVNKHRSVGRTVKELF